MRERERERERERNKEDFINFCGVHVPNIIILHSLHRKSRGTERALKSRPSKPSLYSEAPSASKSRNDSLIMNKAYDEVWSSFSSI